MDITTLPPEPQKPRIRIEMSYDEAVLLKHLFYELELGSRLADPNHPVKTLMTRLPGTTGTRG